MGLCGYGAVERGCRELPIEHIPGVDVCRSEVRCTTESERILRVFRRQQERDESGWNHAVESLLTLRSQVLVELLMDAVVRTMTASPAVMRTELLYI